MAKAAKIIALIGGVLQLAWLPGLLLTLIQLDRTTSQFDSSKVTNNNEVISMLSKATEAMGSSFDAYLLGLGLSLVGVVFFGYALTRLHFRQEWAFWLAAIHGSLLVFVFPFGTPFGLFLLIYALSHRTEFGRRPDLAVPAAS